MTINGNNYTISTSNDGDTSTIVLPSVTGDTPATATYTLGSVEYSSSFTIYESTPSITITAPSSVNELDSFDVTASATDDSGVNSLEVSFNG